MSSVRTGILIAGFMVFVAATPVWAAPITFDLKTGWSEINNPNGVWAYRQGTNKLPHQIDIGTACCAGPASGIGGGWAPSGQHGNFLPLWVKAIADNTPAGFSTGDIVVHSVDSFNGNPDLGEANVTWTAPTTGTIDIAGSLWYTQFPLARSNDFILTLNGNVLTSGTISATNGHNRANPLAFHLGDVNVNSGDVIQLLVRRSSGQSAGSFAGVNLTIIEDDAPTGLTASKFGANAVRLTWTAAPGATSYNVKRGALSGGETLLASGVAATSYVDGGVALNTAYYYVVSAVHGFSESGNSNEVLIRLTRDGRSDYDNDGRADLALYRPATGYWYIKQSSTNYGTYLAFQWGISTDVAVPGDYDGDGRVDLALYRPSTGYWYVLSSSTNYATYLALQWGISTDVPVAGDYDGDGKIDLGLFRPSTGSWYVLLSGANYTTYLAQQWGISTDVPVKGDYDSDGKTDLGLFRPSTGSWYVLLSGANYTTYVARQWGLATDLPVPGDFDGDGKSDMGLYRPSTGYWYILTSSSNFTSYLALQWGISTDIVLGGDYDGDGRTDLALYRPSTGHWYILQSSTNYTTYIDQQWGVSSDIPVLRRQ